MKTILEKVDQGYQNYLDQQLSPQAKVTERTMVSGIPVTIERPLTEEERKEIENERNAMEAFRWEIRNTLGQFPVAVLPKRIFNQMIKDLPFYTFRPDENGKVMAEERRILSFQDQKKEERRERKMAIEDIMSLIAFISFLGEFALLGILYSNLGVFIAMVHMTIALGLSAEKPKLGFLLLSPLNIFPLLFWGKIEKREEEKRRKKKEEEKRSWQRRAKRALWPDRMEPKYGYPIRILLSKPSREESKFLFKIKKLEIPTYLVVHEDGFQIYKEGFQKAREWLADPIVCTDSADGKYVAVLLQYGDIPEEKALIEKIKENFRSLPEELAKEASKWLN